ncbi:MAG: PAS domain S-box protein [Salinivirgaceae bacterium]|nr:PAS domain S-box protein [Salinivirgaceae bacterium]
MKPKLTYQELENENEILRQRFEIYEKDEKFRNYFEFNQAIMLQVNSKTKQILRANEAAVNFYGYPKNELLQKTINDVNTLSPDEISRLMEEAVKRKSNFFEFQHTLSNGEIKDVEVYASHLEIDDAICMIVTIIDITARKKAEQELKIAKEKAEENEEIYRNLVQVMPDGVYKSTNDGVFVDVNPAMVSMLGYANKEELMAIDIKTQLYFHVNDRESVELQVNLKEMGIYRMKKKDGSEIWVEDHGWLTLDKNENIIFHEGIMRDITERMSTEQAGKQAEEKIREKDMQFRKLSANVSDLIYQFTRRPDGTYFVPIASEGIRNIFGCTPEDVADDFTPIGRVIHPNDAARVISDIEYSAEHLTYFTCEFRVQIPGKEIQWILSRSTPEKLPDGSITWYGFNADITGRKRNEQIQKLIHNISNAVAISNNPEEFIVLVKNELETIIDTNNFYVALYDESTDSIDLLYHKDKKDKIKSFQAGKTLTKYVIKTKKSLLATRAVKAKLVKSGEVELVGADSEVWLGVPLFAKGKVSGVIALQSYENEKAYNESDMKTLEIISHQISISLERKKAEQDLKSALVKAQESDQLKTEFLNNMSHEIRTPLNGILGFSKLLDKSNKSEQKRKQYVNIIQDSGNQLMRIIEDILEISQLGTKQVEAIEKEICLNDLLLDLFSIFDIKAKEIKLPLYFKKGLSDKDSWILTDKSKLNKIISNLLENALKFTREGFIEFGYQQLNSSLEIYVKDTGIGIKPESQEIIFERFSQEEKGLSRNVGGLGLGLSISKENAELLGGSIKLQSEKGKGSTFIVTIPYKPVNLKIEKNSSVNDTGKTTKKRDKYTILIVEDEVINYIYLETLIEEEIDLECKTIYARNGKEAVDICTKKEGIDFVLMDLKMPVMDGFEATKLIKELRPDLPIVAQTAYSKQEDRDKAISAGCDDYITKPISEETLNEILIKYLIT